MLIIMYAVGELLHNYGVNYCVSSMVVLIMYH